MPLFLPSIPSFISLVECVRPLKQRSEHSYFLFFGLFAYLDRITSTILSVHRAFFFQFLFITSKGNLGLAFLHCSLFICLYLFSEQMAHNYQYYPYGNIEPLTSQSCWTRSLQLKQEGSRYSFSLFLYLRRLPSNQRVNFLSHSQFCKGVVIKLMLGNASN